MAKRGRKGRKGKRKGRKSYGKKRRSKLSGHQFGIAESLGILKTGLDVASNPSVGSAVKATLAQPSIPGARMTAIALWDNTKRASAPALTGIVVSNADKLPFIGKILAKPKHKIDRVAKKWVGMKL